MPSGPEKIAFGFLFVGLLGFCEWIARSQPRSLPWKQGGARRALRIERGLIRALMVVIALVALSFLMSGVSEL